MEVITEGTNSPKLTLSGSPPPPLPPFLFFLVFASGCLSQLSFSPPPPNVTPDHSAPSLLSKNTFKKFPFPVSPCHMCTLSRPSRLSPSPSIYLSVHLSSRSDTSLSDCVRLEGVQVFRHSLQPRLLDHYYSIISGDGGRAADA